MFVALLSKAVKVHRANTSQESELAFVIGPFQTREALQHWLSVNNTALEEQGVEHVTLSNLHSPIAFRLTTPE